MYLFMPSPLKVVQKVVDKMKNLSDELKIEANMAGELKLSVTTELATISTFYKNLENPKPSIFHFPCGFNLSFIQFFCFSSGRSGTNC